MMKKHILYSLALSLALSMPLAIAADKQVPTQEQLDDSLRVDFWYGGWEPDYTKEAYELMFSYRALDNIHLFAGWGDAEQVYYDRSKIYAGGYYFYQDYSFIRMFVSKKKYDYPNAPNIARPNPDSTSYDEVPRLELEVSHYFSSDLRGGLSYELSRPNFFHDTDETITVHKVGAELFVVAPNPALRGKLYASVLRDPDSDTTEIKGRDNPATPLGTAAVTNVDFKTSTLLGAAAEYVKEQWELEVKVMENRDLDESYDYSLLNKLLFRLDDARTLQFDYVYDKYSDKSSFSGKTADVYMVSYYQQLNPRFRFGLGYKYIDVPSYDESTAFVYLQAKTGVLLQ